MANEILGRAVPITIGGDLQAVARTKNLTINNEPVNVTADGDDGIQRLLTAPGEKAVELSVEMMYDLDDESLIDTALNGSDVTVAVELDYGDFEITGTFFIASFAQGLPYNEAGTVDLSLQSSGAIVKAAT